MRAIKRAVFQIVVHLTGLVACIVLPVFIFFYRLFYRRPVDPRLVWGGVPIISNKYWSGALQRAGYYSRTLMFSYQSSINKADDFDIDIYKLINLRSNILKKPYQYWLAPYVAFIYAICKFDIFHHAFVGGFLGETPLWRLEAPLLKF